MKFKYHIRQGHVPPPQFPFLKKLEGVYDPVKLKFLKIIFIGGGHDPVLIW